jgi:hypothetical protein
MAGVSSVILITLAVASCGKSTESRSPAPVASSASVKAPPATPVIPASPASAPAVAASSNSNAASSNATSKQDTAMDEAIDGSQGDGAHERFKPFIQNFQKAVTEGDKKAVADVVSYPIVVDIGGKKTTVRKPEDFVRDYDRIMTPEIVDAVKQQKYADLMANSQGIMFHRGEIWISGICKDNSCKSYDIRVITIQQGPSD